MEKISGVNVDMPLSDRIEDYFERLRNSKTKRHEQFLLSAGLRLEHVEAATDNPSRATALYSLTVTEDMCNAIGTMHGGAVSAAFDWCTMCTLPAIARKGFYQYAAVSNSITCHFLGACKVGDKIEIKCDVLYATPRECLLNGVIRKVKNGTICYTCQHKMTNIEFLMGPRARI